MNNENNNIDAALLAQDEQIVKFLKGRMTANEEQAFMQELESNPELKARAIATARLVKGMKEVGSAQDQEVVGELLATDKAGVERAAKDAVENRAEATPTTARIVPFRKVVTWFAAAASVALLIWGGIGYNDYRTTTGLGNEYATAFTSSQLSRGDDASNEVEAKLAKLFDNVVDGRDLKSTIHDLTLCWELSKQDTYNNYTDFALEIGWNLAIAHLKNNDRKQARNVLEQLTAIAPTDTALGDKAHELLQKIEES